MVQVAAGPAGGQELLLTERGRAQGSTPSSLSALRPPHIPAPSLMPDDRKPQLPSLSKWDAWGLCPCVCGVGVIGVVSSSEGEMHAEQPPAPYAYPRDGRTSGNSIIKSREASKEN